MPEGRKEVSNKISLEGLDKAAVLAALYNASRPQGMGFLHYDPLPMTTEQAQEFLDGGHAYFDYLKGRVMKVDLSNNELDPYLYDRDNGDGAAARAIVALRRGGENAPEIQRIHQEGKEMAAGSAREAMNTPSRSQTDGNVVTLELGLQDVADKLGPAVEQAMDTPPAQQKE